MTQTKRDELRNVITNILETIQHEIEELEEKTKPIAPDVSLGRLTRLEAMNEKSINESILNDAKMREKRLQFALQKVDTENFGLCRVCEEEINYERLKLMPESTICVECANEQ